MREVAINEPTSISLNSPLTRRNLLRIGSLTSSTVTAGLLLQIPVQQSLNGVSKIWALSQEQDATRKSVAMPTIEFLEENKTLLDGLKIGCSYSPEYMEYLYDAEDGISIGPKTHLAALDFIHKVLGINDLRLGMRWNKIEERPGQYNFGYYETPFLYTASNHINLTAGIGPIRTFRWPEEFLPLHALDDPYLPKKGGIVSASTPLAKKGQKFTDKTLDFLKDLFPDGNITLQPENEPFFRTGSHQWKMGWDHMENIILQAYQKFPNSRILLNSWGYGNLDEIFDFSISMKQKDPTLAGKFTAGLDHYYRYTWEEPILGMGTFDLKLIPIFGDLDNLAITDTDPRVNMATHIKNRSRQEDVLLEISESQAEPWGRFRSPGNSQEEFNFLIARAVQKVGMQNLPLIIRLWGIERLAKKVLTGKLTTDHSAIVAAIQDINLA